jgi:hypothetical protein
MKLTIDTKEDSHDDIRKVIKMLQHLVGENSYSNSNNISSSRNIFDDPSPSLSTYSENNEKPVESVNPTNAFSAMFGDEAPASSMSDNEISTYDSEEKKVEKRLNLDEEIIPY